jgi:chromosome segregation ATPase
MTMFDSAQTTKFASVPIPTTFALYMSKEQELDSQEDTGSPIEQEIERLQNQLALIEALEARNEAQLESFIDHQDQWDSLEEEERQLLQSKDAILQRMEVLSEELIQMWMGQKSMDG